MNMSQVTRGSVSCPRIVEPGVELLYPCLRQSHASGYGFLPPIPLYLVQVWNLKWETDSDRGQNEKKLAQTGTVSRSTKGFLISPTSRLHHTQTGCWHNGSGGFIALYYIYNPLGVCDQESKQSQIFIFGYINSSLLTASIKNVYEVNFFLEHPHLCSHSSIMLPLLLSWET